MSWLDNFHFLRPAWLLLIPVGCAVLWALRQPGGSMRAWQQVCDEHLLRYLSVGESTGSNQSMFGLLAAAWFIGAIALAGPVWQKVPQTLLENSAARVIVFDLSRSMLATDLKPSRLARARFKMEDLLARTREGQTGLITYAADAYVVSPLTKDSKTISNLLRALDPSIMPVQGSSLSEGLELAEDLLRRANAAGGSILVVADDADTAAVAKAEQLAGDGVLVSVLAVGTDDGGPIVMNDGRLLADRFGDAITPTLGAENLQQLARRGGGRYAAVTSDSRDLDYLLQRQNNAGTGGADSAEQSDIWLDRGPWLVLLLLPIVALAFRRGWVVGCALILLLPPDSATASWRDWFRNQEQRAEQAMAAEDYQRALNESKNLIRSGNAAYRLGEFALAEQFYRQSDSVDGYYNLGNALASQQRIDEAIDAYDRTLALEPEHEDAAYNKALLEELKEQQQQEQDQQDQQQEQDRQEQEQDQEQQDQQQSESEQDQSEEEQQQQDAQPEPNESDPMDEEERQAVEQWLRRVPDDPGGLLRRKFRLQHQRRGSPAPETDEEW